MNDDMLEIYQQSLSSRTKQAPFVAQARKFLVWLKDRNFNKESVQKYLAHLQHEGYADGTIANTFKIIKRLATVNAIYLDFRRDERPRVRETEMYSPALDPNDIKAMVDCVRGIAAADIEVRPEHAAFLALSTVYGLRRIEMIEMCPQYIDVPNRALFVQTAKKGRERYHMIPDNIVPYLAAWDFRRRFSTSGMTRLFDEIKQMIGLDIDEVGWHAIRRSAVTAAWDCGLSEPQIVSFYRWKRPMTNMALRYATAKMVGRAGEHAAVPFGDREVDQVVFTKHPFVRFWD